MCTEWDDETCGYMWLVHLAIHLDIANWGQTCYKCCAEDDVSCPFNPLEYGPKTMRSKR